MQIEFHPHALERMYERGANEQEVLNTIEEGEKFPAKLGRTGFRSNFIFNSHWRGVKYKMKQIEVITVYEEDEIFVITIIIRYF